MATEQDLYLPMCSRLKRCLFFYHRLGWRATPWLHECCNWKDGNTGEDRCFAADTEKEHTWMHLGAGGRQKSCYRSTAYFSFAFLTMIFVGHIGNRELSAVAIGLSVVSNFSFGFLLGMGSALETLCGQAFGAGQMFALAINFPTQKFLQAQSKVAALAWIGFAALIAHVGLLALFVSLLGWGIAGAAAAYDISSWLTAIAQVAYVVGWCRDGWTGLSRAAFNELWAFVKLSLASAVMLCLEIWYMMVLVVLTGHLDDAEIAVDSISICMNINGWEGMLFIGLSAAISGIWAGMLCGTALQTGILMYMVFKTDWKAEVNLINVGLVLVCLEGKIHVERKWYLSRRVV
ncbi:Protein TRANSPARENT TESTA 12 [Triticum urartu]|uniref:Protein TRANSPARENT TESTA 12 n=1 Tax=Triticum urartu TaxID=4572 RepID=M7ZJK9_TRIUA|nr:Protein TRANSPARENT TESTA 12 [Triticum urartu]